MTLSIHIVVSAGAPSKRIIHADAMDYQVKLTVGGPHLQAGGSVYTGEVTLLRDASGRMTADYAPSIDGWCSAGLLAAIAELPGERPSAAVVACLRSADSASGTMLEFDDEASLGYPKARAAGEEDASTFMALRPRSEWAQTIAIGAKSPSDAMVNWLVESRLASVLGVAAWPRGAHPTDDARAALRAYDEAWRETVEMALDSESMEDAHECGDVHGSAENGYRCAKPAGHHGDHATEGNYTIWPRR